MPTSRLNALEIEMAQVGRKRAWSARYLGGATMRNAWADGRDLLVEAFNAETREFEVHCIDLQNGNPKWVSVLGKRGLKYPPGVGDAFVVFLLDGGGMKVVTRNIGSAWKRLQIPLRNVPLSSAGSSESTIYLASLSDQRIQALNPATGQVGWGYRSFSPISTGPLVTPRLPRRLVLLGNAAGEVHALPAAAWSDIPPRKASWIYRTLGPISAGMAAASSINTKTRNMELYILVPCEDSGLYCLDGAAGVARWIQRTDRPFISTPQIAAGRVFAHNEERMFVLDLGQGADGPRSWAGSRAGEDLRPFERTQVVYAADDQRAYLGLEDRMVMRVNGGTGALQAQARLAHFDRIIPATGPDLLVGLTTDGHIVAFH